MSRVRDLIVAVEHIHRPDIPGFEDACCIECVTPWPCDTAVLLASWKELAS